MQTWFIAAAFAVLPIIGVAHAEGTAPTVTIDAGRLTGTTQGEADVFLGIPYAAAPIGARRWMPPAPVAAWKDSRPANAYGATCPQPKLAMMGATTQSEDCLFINVWAPKGAASSTKKLPVMVWIHGGAYFLGSGNIADTSAFTRDGVIVVSMNYRLGRLGFFAHPALTAEAPQGALGNYGLMDQVSALQWVQRNIAAFGGDPQRVTIFGCSAGGTFTNMLLTSPKARGLFNGAIAQSDPFNEAWPRLKRVAAPGAATAEEHGELFATSVGLSHATAAQLRALPVDRLLHTVENSSVARVLPVIDGEYLVDRGADAFAAGEVAKVPYINSTNSWEGSLAMMFKTTGPDAIASLGARRDEVLALYPADVRNDPSKVGPLLFGDLSFLAPQRTAVKLASDQGVPTWAMRFNYLPEQLRSKQLPGAAHCSDVGYQFESFSGPTMTPFKPTDAEWALAKVMHTYWVNFAVNGDPNGKGLPQWPRFTSKQQNVLTVNNDGPQVVENPEGKRMDVLEPLSLGLMRAAP